MPATMTLQEHLQSLRQTIALMLWFVRHWLASHGEEGFAHVLRQRTDVFLKTDLYDGRRFKLIEWNDPRWLELEARARELYERTRGPAGETAFEEQALEVFWPSIQRRARADHRRGPEPRFLPGARVCGCLWCTPPEGGEDSRRLFFHIYNPCRPRSIFDDPAYLPACLRQLMEAAEREFGCDSLSTTTWLNSYEPWLRVFGPSWRENLGPQMRAPTAGLGFWGQFLNARGQFNDKHARVLRQTGEFPFWPRPGWCRFDALRRHLDRLERPG